MTRVKMYEYYAKQAVQPTFADFGTDTDLSRYAEMRRAAFHRLVLPPELFAGKRVLEFGPDTGENALVFAQWGAQLTLAEPNDAAHAFILRYFDKFGLGSRLDGIVSASLLDYEPSERFDVVDAEGFIYTVQPTSAWIAKMAECLVPGGVFIVSYVEYYGGFLELLLKAIYSRVVRDPAHEQGLETAKLLFQAKWDSIPHTRKIESWFMDVLQNPFVRLQYFIDPAMLLMEAAKGGFRLHSSWPHYADALAITWIKARDSREEEVKSSVAFVEQSRVSHLLGHKYFLPFVTPELNSQVKQLVEANDALIDGCSPERVNAAGELVDGIIAMLENAPAVTDGSGSAKKTLTMIRSAYELMRRDGVRELIDFCQSDETFIASWGMPTHHAVFRYSPQRVR